MNKQRKVVITTTYNEMGIIIDTKAEEVTQPNLQPTCNKIATDTISRRLAIDKFAAYIYHAFKDFYRIGLHRKTLTPEQCRHVAGNVLAEVPSVQPERKPGKWELWRCGMYKCSKCGHIYTELTDPHRCGAKYCPNCGKPMRNE